MKSILPPSGVRGDGWIGKLIGFRPWSIDFLIWTQGAPRPHTCTYMYVVFGAQLLINRHMRQYTGQISHKEARLSRINVVICLEVCHPSMIRCLVADYRFIGHSGLHRSRFSTKPKQARHGFWGHESLLSAGFRAGSPPAESVVSWGHQDNLFER